MNCQNAPSVNYDTSEDVCKSIISGTCPDVVELDAASNSSIDEIRELRKLARTNPVMCNKKIFIIDEVHCLRKDAASALLKILEEPPRNTIFVLCTSEPQKMLKTILSRCQRFDLRKVSTKELSSHLRYICEQEGVQKIEDEALSIIARAGTGSVRDSISLLDAVISNSEKEVTVKITEEVINYTGMSFFFTLTQNILNLEKVKTFIHLKKALSVGKDPQEVFYGFLEYVHSTMLSKTLGTDSFLYVEKSIVESWRKQRDGNTIEDFLLIYNTIEQYMLDLHYKPRVDLALDTCIIDLINIFEKRTKK
jgi:DNA polymerase-3 subunit gamma/tau